MAKSPFLIVLTLSLAALFFHGCLAANKQSRMRHLQDRRSQCRLENLNPLLPAQRIQHEAGHTDVWDQNDDQMQCAGMAATRHNIEPRGLLLTSFNNAPMLAYVVQGRGILGVVKPGCPETYQSFQQSEQEEGSSQRGIRDQHQKIRNLVKGDVVALRAGIAHWCYNEGTERLVLLVVHDTNNYANQLDLNLRRFFLAGNPQEQQQQQGGLSERSIGQSVLQSFEDDVLAEIFGVSVETARKIQSRNDKRGSIVRVEEELRLVRPPPLREQEGGRGIMRDEMGEGNGFEETRCSLRLIENVDDPRRADIYSAGGGHLTTLNSYNLPILKHIKMSAERGLLNRDAMIGPVWNTNAHSLMYVIRGTGRVQIAGPSSRPAFDAVVREDQFVFIPQNFAVVVKQVGQEDLEWISFKTNENAKMSNLAGKTSAFRSIPEGVLMNAYQISRDEARRIKYNNPEVTIHTPRSFSPHQDMESFWSIV